MDESSLPAGVMPGDCTEDAHCLPSSLEGEAVCCKYMCVSVTCKRAPTLTFYSLPSI